MKQQKKSWRGVSPAFFSFVCDNGKANVEIVVDRFVAEAVEERAGAVLDVVFRAVDHDFAGRGGLVGRGRDVGVEFHFFRRAFDGEVGDDFVVAFCVRGNRFFDGQFSGRESGGIEKIGRFEVADEFVGT